VIGNLAVGIQDFVIPAPLGDFESIATVTVTGATQASIDFTSIPSTYQHLQIRGLVRDNRSGITLNSSQMRINSDSGNNYAWHLLYGDGSSATSAAGSSASFGYLSVHTGASATADRFGVFVADFLDYNNTNKTKTVRCLTGVDNNGSGFARLGSVLWNNTNAITSISIFPESASWVTNSTIALYGIKG
jgi:hypothetical protein